MAFTSQPNNYCPTFTFCSTFSGKNGQSGQRWLQKFEYEHERYLVAGSRITPEIYLRTVDMLLVEDAETWADTTAQVAELFLEKSPCQDDVEKFKALFNHKYPARATIQFNFTSEIGKLRQGPDESLESYYNRVRYLLCLAGVDEYPKLQQLPALSKTEATVLEIVLAAFIKGLSDGNLVLDTVRGLSLPESSLSDVYRKVKMSALAQELQKKADGLEYFEDLVNEMRALSLGQPYEIALRASTSSSPMSVIYEQDSNADDSISTSLQSTLAGPIENTEDGGISLPTPNNVLEPRLVQALIGGNTQSPVSKHSPAKESIVSKFPAISKRLLANAQNSIRKSSEGGFSKTFPAETLNQRVVSAEIFNQPVSNSSPQADTKKPKNSKKKKKEKDPLSAEAATVRHEMIASLNENGTDGRGVGLTLRGVMEEIWRKDPQKAEEMTSLEFMTAVGEALHQKSLDYGIYENEES
ncbi:MAG: hypothetical protein MMC33_002828 [Icmadophila ericetorum]|nr:hypothetical protein [Icmadophila ericetorum]